MSAPFPAIPYGRAGFEAIRREGCLYVDKTRFLHAPPVLRATAHLDVEAAHQRAQVRHVFLILLRHPVHGDVAAAVGARLRGGRRMGLVHPGRRPAASLLPGMR